MARERLHKRRTLLKFGENKIPVIAGVQSSLLVGNQDDNNQIGATTRRDFRRNRVKLPTSNLPHRRARVDRRHSNAAVAQVAHDHITGRRGADLVFRGKQIFYAGQSFV